MKKSTINVKDLIDTLDTNLKQQQKDQIFAKVNYDKFREKLRVQREIVKNQQGKHKRATEFLSYEETINKINDATQKNNLKLKNLLEKCKLEDKIIEMKIKQIDKKKEQIDLVIKDFQIDQNLNISIENAMSPLSNGHYRICSKEKFKQTILPRPSARNEPRMSLFLNQMETITDHLQYHPFIKDDSVYKQI